MNEDIAAAGMPIDFNVGRVARSDQMEAALTEVAKLVAGYYRALIQQGIEREYAFALTSNYQELLLSGARRLD